MKKIILAGSLHELEVQIKSCYDDYEVITLQKRDDIIKILKDEEVYLVIISLFTEDYDGLQLLKSIRTLKKSSQPTYLICISDILSTYISTELNMLNVDYVFGPNTLIEDVSDFIEELELQQKINKNPNSLKLDVTIAKILHEIGVPSHILGYRYLKYGIAMIVEDVNVLQSITKILYPTIAKKFDSTNIRVERAIRHAIEVAWQKQNIEVVNEVFSNTLDYHDLRPTNSEFMAMVADKILMENEIAK